MQEDFQTNISSYRSDINIAGFFKIWEVNPKTGSKRLLIDKKNMILNSGADILAQALAGVSNSSISHIYVGYNNVASSFTPPTIDKAYSVKFDTYGTGLYTTYGYLRLPLAYTPSFMAQSGYKNNIALFTGVIATSDNYYGAQFRSSVDGDVDNPPSQLFEVALVSATDPSSPAQDKIFSRANFDPVTYDPNFNLTITWGIQFQA